MIANQHILSMRTHEQALSSQKRWNLKSNPLDVPFLAENRCPMIPFAGILFPSRIDGEELIEAEKNGLKCFGRWEPTCSEGNRQRARTIPTAVTSEMT